MSHPHVLKTTEFVFKEMKKAQKEADKKFQEENPMDAWIEENLAELKTDFELDHHFDDQTKILETQHMAR